MPQSETEVEDTAVDSTTEDNQNDHENDSTSESEGTSEAEASDVSKSETPEQRLARLKRQYEREAKKQGIGNEESPKKTDKGTGLEEKYNRLALKQEGYTDRAEQDAIIKYAKFEEVDVEEAVKSPIAQAIIKGLRDKASTPSPSVRTSKNGAPSIDGLVAKYKADKYLSPDEMKQVRKKLRG